MLDNPDKDGLYPTSKCYQELYDFVVKQKQKALSRQREEIIEIVKENIIEDKQIIAETPEYKFARGLLNVKLKRILTEITKLDD